MFKDRASDYCFFNNALRLFDDVDLKKFEENNQLVYEVIKIIKGKPLFWEEHIDRIYMSFDKIGLNLGLDRKIFEDGAKKIIHRDQLGDNNIKIIIGKFDNDIKLLIYNIKSTYPREELKKDGVVVDLFNYERLNPGAKVVNVNYKKQVSKFINEKNIFEALLVDHNGVITEGSRSNIFFIRDSSIYTSKSSGVLLGITRKKLLDLFDLLELEVKELDIKVSDLSKYEAAFLSGTSINALAIKSIGNYVLSTSDNSCYKKISENFEKMILKSTCW